MAMNARFEVGVLHPFYTSQIPAIKKPTLTGWFFWGNLVGMRGFEPPTPDTP